MKKVRILRCCLLIAALLLLFAGCAEKKQEIHWDLYGTWITEDGEIGGNVLFSIGGELITEDVEIGSLQAVNFSIQWPENFRYGNGDEDLFGAYAFHEAEGSDSVWFDCIGFAYDPMKNELVAENFALSPERGYVVVYWPGNDALYLVASIDQETDPQDIAKWYSSLEHSR